MSKKNPGKAAGAGSGAAAEPGKPLAQENPPGPGKAGSGAAAGAPVRLQKLLAEAGVGSRRHCEGLIRAGRVRVDGEPVTQLGIKAASGARVEVDGAPVLLFQRGAPAPDAGPDGSAARSMAYGAAGVREPVYILLHKPVGVVTSAKDQFGRKTVLDLIKGGVRERERLYPVGRLDYHTSGLLILTNDGDFTYFATHPKHEIEKAYEVHADRAPSAAELRRLSGGVTLDGGFRTAPARLFLDKADPRKLTVVIHEGKNRQVRRM
ncbi:MAG: rRNA pseudouridine synthase, partial [Clostridiales bacterium]|nr:rRNA pseudouridine synthase [Clostridiales bacterium]